MIKNLGKFAHPKKKASFMAKRSVGFKPQLGNQGSLPAPPKSKPDPVNMVVHDVSMTGATPAAGAMPVGTIKPNLAARPAGSGTSVAPGKKKLTRPPVHKRAKRATVPFFGGY